MRPGLLVLHLLPALVAVMPLAQTANAQATSNSVQLAWTTPGDDSLTGTASQFDLRYSTSAITAANFASATRWTGTPAPAAPGTRQSTTVTGLQPSTTYWFAIKTADEVPNWSGISNIISVTTLPPSDTIRPARVASLVVTGTTETTASLAWTAVGDDSLTGTAASYDIRYSTSPINDANWSAATQVSGEPAPATPGTSQSHTVTGLTRQTTYYFAIRVADEAGHVSALSNVPGATTPDQTRPATVNDLGFIWWMDSIAPLAAARTDGEGAGCAST
jgi:phosphodiesterase/alkaline phosphatase D-like protein